MLACVTETPPLLVQQLTKSYGAVAAVKNVSFSALAGQVTAVLGPNGAGKTTTIECCEGLRHPDGGTVRVLGVTPATANAEVRGRVGVMLQDGGLPLAATASQVLMHVAQLYGGRRSGASDRAKALARRLELPITSRAPLRRLSGGQRARLALACALLGEPDLVFLDEPTAGMDPLARRVVHDLIDETRQRGAAVILTTHLLPEAQALADRVVLLSRGEVVADATPAQLMAASTDDSVLLTLGPDATGGQITAAELADALGASVSIEPAGPGRWSLNPRPNPQQLAQLTQVLAARDVEVTALAPPTRDLERVFLELTDTPEGTS